MRSRRRAAAFTLLEVLLVMAILGILMAVGYLNLMQAHHRAVARQAATELATALRNARSEAQRFNAPVTVTFTAGPPDVVTVTRGAVVRNITLPEVVTLVDVGATPTVQFVPPHGSVAVAGAAFRIEHPRVAADPIVGVTGLIGKVVSYDEP